MIDEIQKIVEWYRELPSHFNSINELMHKRQRLAGYYFGLNGQLGDAREIWNEKKSKYEQKKMHLRAQFTAKGTTKANTLSRANSTREYEAEEQAQADFYKLYYYTRAIEQILSAMNQQIAQLREELNKSNLQNG